jgi:hypothetical protein
MSVCYVRRVLCVQCVFYLFCSCRRRGGEVHRPVKSCSACTSVVCQPSLGRRIHRVIQRFKALEHNLKAPLELHSTCAGQLDARKVETTRAAFAVRVALRRFYLWVGGSSCLGRGGLLGFGFLLFLLLLRQSLFLCEQLCLRHLPRHVSPVWESPCVC